MKRVIIFCIIIFTVTSLWAQNRAKEFYISSFKCLEMDLDARTLHPVIDQNGKKAALIKVVTTHTGFDFDIGVMGVTEVHQESGEIWVYIPEKAQRITLRHPKFGIIRDYFFPIPIESATVYEMVLATPQNNNGEIPQTIVIEHKFTSTENGLSNSQNISAADNRVVKNKKRRNLSGSKRIEYKGFMMLADFGVNRTPSYGIRAAYYKKIGGYINFRSNFKRGNSDYGCLSDGTIGNSSFIWTTGNEKTSRTNISAGVISQITGWLSLYAGAGYGTNTLTWEDVGGKWAKVDDFSYKGAAIDAGAVFTINNFAISAGITSIAFDWGEFSLGFGVRF